LGYERFATKSFYDNGDIEANLLKKLEKEFEDQLNEFVE
jgi:hypothetical protein